MKAEHDAARDAARAARLDDLIEQWNELKAWWVDLRSPSVSRERSASNDARSARARNRAAPVTDVTNRPDVEEVALSPVIVTANRVEADASATTTRIEVTPWSPDRPYLRALDAAPLTDIDRVIAEQERQHGDLPAFYFDAANWLEAKGRRPDAVSRPRPQSRPRLVRPRRTAVQRRRDRPRGSRPRPRERPPSRIAARPFAAWRPSPRSSRRR